MNAKQEPVENYGFMFQAVPPDAQEKLNLEQTLAALRMLSEHTDLRVFANALRTKLDEMATQGFGYGGVA